MRKQNSLKLLLCTLLMCIGLNAWGTQVQVDTLAFTGWTSDPSSAYSSTEFTNIGCTFAYMNNNWSSKSSWAYVRFGGKGGSTATSTTTATSYVKYNTASTAIINQVNVYHNGISNTSVTINNITLTVYSDNAFSNQIDQIVMTSFTPAIAKSTAGKITFNKASGYWPTGSYFKVSVNWTIKGTNNYGFDVKALSFYGPQNSSTFTVNYNAGTNGTCTKQNDTESSVGSGVTLPSCTANTGYGFLGWTATENKTTIDAGLIAGATYRPQANTTLYAVYGSLYTVTIETPENGSLSVLYNGNTVSTGAQLPSGAALSITATPADGYKFRNLQVNDGTAHTYTTSNTKDWTLASNITVKANFDAIVYRTITWSVNGNTSAITASQVEDGTNITFPTDVDDIFGKKFMGWSASSTASSAGDLVSGNVAASEAKTYYAVFATVESRGKGGSTLLTYENVHSAYTTDGVDRDMQNVTGYKYYGCIQGKESGATVNSILQMRKMSNDVVTSWIYNSSAIDIEKIVITYTSSNNKLCNVYFGNAANPTGTATTCDGTANYAGANTFTNPGTFKYFRIENPKNGAMYISSIEVFYQGAVTYSAYTTTIGTSVDVTVTSAGYATYCPEYDVLVPAADVVYYASAVTNDAITFTGLAADTKVKAGEGLLIKGAGDYTFAYTTGATALGDNNKLVGVLTATPAANLPANSYILALDDNGVAAFCSVSGGTLAAGKAYIVRPAASSGTAPLRIAFETEGEQTATAVETVESSDEAVKFIENGQILIRKNGVVYTVLGQVVR